MKVAKVEFRPMTVYDFVKLKKSKPYKTQRSTAKVVNFSQIFNGGAWPLAEALELGGFTEQDADEFIADLNLQDELATVMERHGDMGLRKCKYLTAAAFMVDKFFKQYPGLMSRIIREIDFALAHGYVRSWHGPVRHLEELTYCKLSDKKYAAGVDKVLYSRMVSNLKNIAANSPVQTFEASIVMPSMNMIGRTLRANHMHTRIWNMVHDSIDLYMDPDEAELAMSLAIFVMGLRRNPTNGVAMIADIEVSKRNPEKIKEAFDMQRELYRLERLWLESDKQDTATETAMKETRHKLNDMYEKDLQFYKHGEELEVKPLGEAIKNYMANHPSAQPFKVAKPFEMGTQDPDVALAGGTRTLAK